MKDHHTPRGGRSLILGIACLGFAGQAFAQTDIPRGTLAVDNTLVRVGTHSKLDWNIEYPVAIRNLVDVTKSGTIIPKKQLRLKARVLGVAYQSGNTLLSVECHWSKNSGSWQRIFNGTSRAVNPSKVLLDTVVNANERIDLAGRGSSGSSWNPQHHTRVSDVYVNVLQNGDLPPSYIPAYKQSSVESFLQPYIDGMGRIRIGPRDLIVVWELSTAKVGSTYFDMQDLVVLLTFE